MAATVLFVCLHGSAKSLIVAEHFRRLAGARGLATEADSGGLEPDDAIPARVVQGLRDDGIDVQGRRPRRPTAADVDGATVVVSFCDLAELAPHARRIERWDDVPAVSEGFEQARDAIVARVSRLLDDASFRQ